ncbi:hypothetical protein TNCV_2977921 [Trichonephila clavipes]|nr:hypothetical protein TNCV_2977921 [Trichonephila clavipes]
MDMSPGDFHAFGPLKKSLKGKRFNSDDELKDAMKDWVSSRPQEFWKQGTLHLVNEIIVLSNDDLEIAIVWLGENISEALVEASKPKFKQPPLKLSSEIIAKIPLRNHVRKFWQRARDPVLKSEFRALNCEVTKDLRHFSQSRWESHIAALMPETGTLEKNLPIQKITSKHPPP